MIMKVQYLFQIYYNYSQTLAIFSTGSWKTGNKDIFYHGITSKCSITSVHAAVGIMSLGISKGIVVGVLTAGGTAISYDDK